VVAFTIDHTNFRFCCKENSDKPHTKWRVYAKKVACTCTHTHTRHRAHMLLQLMGGSSRQASCCAPRRG
jgi:hypothetical protein